MPSGETDPKPSDKPPEKDAEKEREGDKNVDRDGRERQPTQQSGEK